MVSHLGNPVNSEGFFVFILFFVFNFSLLIFSNKAIECHSIQDEGVPEDEEDMEPDPQHQLSGPKICDCSTLSSLLCNINMNLQVPLPLRSRTLQPPIFCLQGQTLYPSLHPCLHQHKALFPPAQSGPLIPTTR